MRKYHNFKGKSRISGWQGAQKAVLYVLWGTRRVFFVLRTILKFSFPLLSGARGRTGVAHLSFFFCALQYLRVFEVHLKDTDKYICLFISILESDVKKRMLILKFPPQYYIYVHFLGVEPLEGMKNYKLILLGLMSAHQLTHICSYI